MENEILEELLSCSLFRDMAKADVERLLAEENHKIDHYNKGDVVALVGYPCNYLLVVLKGALVARMVSESGKFVDIEKLEKGRVVAPAMLFAEDNVFPVNVIPDEEVVLFKLKRELFLDWMQRDKRLLFNFIQLISDVNRFLTKKIHFLTLKSLRGKIAEYLIYLSEKDNSKNKVTIPITRQELADKFGVSRQSLIRSLSELEGEQLLKIDNREITILDRRALQQEL